MVYPRRWSVSGRTNNDFGERSQALHRLDARSLATASSPGGNGAFFCIRTTQILVPRPDRLFLSTQTHDIMERCYQSTAEFLHFIHYNIPTNNTTCANIHKILETCRWCGRAFTTTLGCHHLNADNFQQRYSSTFACITSKWLLMLPHANTRQLLPVQCTLKLCTKNLLSSNN